MLQSLQPIRRHTSAPAHCPLDVVAGALHTSPGLWRSTPTPRARWKIRIPAPTDLGASDADLVGGPVSRRSFPGAGEHSVPEQAAVLPVENLRLRFEWCSSWLSDRARPGW